jgi:hypothetical protein
MRTIVKAALVALAATGAAVAGVVWWPRDYRARVVAAAEGELGKSDARPYWLEVSNGAQGPFPPNWCGAFALWALHKAGLGLSRHWVVGKGFLLTPPALPQTRTPEPGDVAYFERLQHQAIVAKVYPDGSVDLLNGNGTGGKVTRSHVQPSQVTAFFSIAPLIPGNENARPV